jgi:hypothetical protein
MIAWGKGLKEGLELACLFSRSLFPWSLSFWVFAMKWVLINLGSCDHSL